MFYFISFRLLIKAFADISGELTFFRDPTAIVISY